MPDTPMPDAQTVDVPIPIDASLAPELDDPAMRLVAGHMVNRFLRSAGIEKLFALMDAVSDEARRRGLTDEILNEELAAYNAERRDASPAA